MPPWGTCWSWARWRPGNTGKIGRLAAQYGVDYLVVYGSFRLEVAAGAREGGLAAARLFPVTHLADAPGCSRNCWSRVTGCW